MRGPLARPHDAAPIINRRATATAAASRQNPRIPTSTRRTDDAPPREPYSNSTGGVALAAHPLARLRRGHRPYARWVPNQLENAGRVAVSTQICEAETETGRRELRQRLCRIISDANGGGLSQ